ncbi:hypothetical protein J27TS7_10560 [Paenibacillus dendritiformis]|uniref:hypothetical protein n=1 Tax=Paenibacillus dendritiformis TaxID=130049 RepID=UPI001B2638EC|nr:hypothetical protein [Paenibacillus dendritiformis]GIO71542.1 hypothetical protein J27TS7_10560 [Paenibacillus dendritiformis]
MNREVLVEQALEAGKNAQRNLKIIQENPEKIHPGKHEDAMAYLNKMIRFSEEEIENARRAGRTSSLRTRLKYLVSSIVSPSRGKRKEGTV